MTDDKRERITPEWCLNMARLEGDQEIGAGALAADPLNPLPCTIPPEGWRCSREAGHEGPCAASPEHEDHPMNPVEGMLTEEPIDWILSDGTRPSLACSKCGRRTPMLIHGLGFDCCSPRTALEDPSHAD